ncbi:glutaredoxin family protein [Aurantimicrobium sp. INA4]|uniref:glutaredoxin family protein n=1 Tax=Aurantimicrobium sp. INA4 TaxID=2986279 RepID=UPI0024921662|nr:glutaredoxin family protein [Aurantimicrobium sp. INA4]
MSTITLTLIGKPGCHLCEDAEVAVTGVLADFESDQVVLEQKSIEDDQDLFDSYWDQIPVLLIDGKVHNYWRIDPERLRLALKERT